MMAVTRLRLYQDDVIARARDEVAAGRRRILLVAPTGAGKTVIGGDIVRRAVERGRRAVFLAHRRELITQASSKLFAIQVDHGIVQAGFPTRPDAPVQVASVQTLFQRAIRGSAMELPPADLVIVDEAHHSRATTYQKILAAYPDATVIGLTATPCRADGRGLGNVFDVIVECPSVAELMRLGYLVPAKVYAPSEPDLKGLKVRQGDYVAEQVAERIDKPELVGDIVANWSKLGGGRKTIVFAAGVKHSVHIRDQFRKADIWAEHIDGSTPTEERDRILAGFATGNVQVVCNAMVLTEGFDCPDVGCLVLARPTKSMGLFRQMIGRALRTAPGKTDCIILDHSGAVFEHGLPDEPVIWTLAEDKRAENPKQSARKMKGLSARLQACPECHAIRKGGMACTACGWRPPARGQRVDFVDGDLGRVDAQRRAAKRSTSAEDRRRFYCMLVGHAQQRSYSPGWAAHKYKEKFGAWPDRSWRSAPPLDPDGALRAWIQSRNIARAKAMQASAA